MTDIAKTVDGMLLQGMKWEDMNREFKSAVIQTAISQYGGNISRAARALGIHRNNLIRWKRELGLTTQ